MMYAVVTVYISQSRVWNRWNFISIFFPRTWRAPPCARKVIDNKNRSPHVENPTGGAAAREDPGESQHNLKRICALVIHIIHTSHGCSCAGQTRRGVQVRPRRAQLVKGLSKLSVCLYLSSIGLSGSRRRSMHHACCASGRIGRRGLDGW